MKRLPTLSLIALSTLALGSAGFAQIIVNDTWQDGTRDDPAAPVYSEMGVDSDVDGDIESAWFNGGTGAFDPVASGGPLRADSEGSTSSHSLTTYFTPEGQELTLADAGNSLTVTWNFKVDGIVQDNTSHGLRLALVDSPAASRISSDTSPGSSTYAGYSLFMNMNSNTFTRSDPIELYERTTPGTAGNLLSSSSAWISLDQDGGNGNTAYIPGTEYSMMMTLTRTALGELDILTTVTGGLLDGDGEMSISYLDTTPNGGNYSFDTFQFRPDGIDKAWEVIDTTLFKVEFIPEPTTFALLGLGGLALMLRRRK